MISNLSYLSIVLRNLLFHRPQLILSLLLLSANSYTSLKIQH